MLLGQRVDEPWGSNSSSPGSWTRSDQGEMAARDVFRCHPRVFSGSTTAAFWCSIVVAKKEDLEIIATWIQRGYCSGLGVEVIGAPSLSVGFSVLQEVRANR